MDQSESFAEQSGPKDVVYTGEQVSKIIISPFGDVRCTYVSKISIVMKDGAVLSFAPKLDMFPHSLVAGIERSWGRTIV